MAERKDCFAVISKFEKLCKSRGVIIKLNRYSERWAADALLESMTMDEIERAMNHYFSIHSDKEWVPSWQFFARSADRLLNASVEAEKDARDRAVAREKLRRVINES